MSPEPSYWRRCGTCRKELGFEAPYFQCSVSTCRRPRTGLVFCSVPCWDAHVPLLRHRESWAEPATSPSREAWAKQQSEAAAKERRKG